jgi:hypothetical protein
MTLELADFDRLPGYAGLLQAGRHSALANRFHFWRGLSGRRYACTRFPAGRVPEYAGAVSLFVRRSGNTFDLIGASVDPGCPVIPLGTDEVHLHIVDGGADPLESVLRDLSPLAAGYGIPVNFARRAA